MSARICNGFRSYWIIPAPTEAVGALGGLEQIDESAD
jgi:hypothetical protein